MILSDEPKSRNNVSIFASCLESNQKQKKKYYDFFHSLRHRFVSQDVENYYFTGSLKWRLVACVWVLRRIKANKGSFWCSRFLLIVFKEFQAELEYCVSMERMSSLRGSSRWCSNLAWSEKSIPKSVVKRELWVVVSWCCKYNLVVTLDKNPKSMVICFTIIFEGKKDYRWRENLSTSSQ